MEHRDEDTILTEVLEERAHSPQLLADFGRAIIENPALGETYALMRRIETDAPEAAATDAIPDLSDAVMQRINALPGQEEPVRGAQIAWQRMLTGACAVLVAPLVLLYLGWQGRMWLLDASVGPALIEPLRHSMLQWSGNVAEIHTGVLASVAALVPLVAFAGNWWLRTAEPLAGITASRDHR